MEGSAEDFSRLLEMRSAIDLANSDSAAARALWKLRDQLGAWFGIGRSRVGAGERREEKRLTIPGTSETSLSERLPDDLRGSAEGEDFALLPFSPLYRTDVEAAAEISNQTVHGVMHLAWVEQGDGRYRGQMAVYVKPRGRLGQAYMELIKPFRYWIVYPALMRQFERAWTRRADR